MTDTKEIKEKLRNGEEVSVSEIFSKNEQNDDLDELEELALKSIEKSKEDHEKQILKEIKERQEESISFYQAVKENKIEEVKDLIAKDCAREEYYDTCEGYRGIYVGIRLDVPSAEMAQILIDDARQSGNKSSDFEEALICKCIELHPEKFSDWDRLAQRNKISYEFKTQDVNAFERYVKAGLSPKCYDFDTVYRRYVDAKNGYEVPQGNGPDRYIAPDPQREAELKKELLTVITMGYPVDKSFASLKFIQGIREEREHRAKQKEIQEQKEREKQETRENSEGTIKAQYKEGQLHGVYKELDANGAVIEKYYENGVDVTEKRKALKKIAERRIAKEEKLSAEKGKPIILKKMNNIQKALALKKAQKESER